MSTPGHQHMVLRRIATTVAGLALLASLPVTASAAGGLFPKMPPAPKAYVVDIHQDTGDAWMTAWALQGMINQKSAELYLINNPWDWDPLKDCGEPYDELPALTGTNAGLRTLFQKYQGRVKKMF